MSFQEMALLVLIAAAFGVWTLVGVLAVHAVG